MIDWLTRWVRRTAPGGEDRSEMRVPQTQVELGEAAYREGMRLYAEGNLSEAAEHFEAAIRTRHDWAKAHYRLGQCRHHERRNEEAYDAYVMSLHFEPGSSQVRLALAQSESALARTDEAIATLDALLADDPGCADAHYLRGTLLLRRGAAADAAASFEQAIIADPAHADAHNDLGYVLFRELEDYERGARHIEHALMLRPDHRDAQCNRTMVLSQFGDQDEALAACDRLLDAVPELHEVRLNRALALLKMGCYESAWDDYEARRQARSNYKARTLPWPEWQGEDLRGKTILVHGEQGLGDEIMFASCFEDIIARAQHVVIECAPRLQALFQRSFPGTTVYHGKQSVENPEWLKEAPPIDLQLPAGSLPRYFRRRRSDFPTRKRYLVPDAERVRFWGARLAALGPELKVGLSWRGGMRSTRRSLRSIDVTSLIPILRLSGARFVDLQYGDTSEDRAELAAHGFGMARWPEAIEDLDETAALLAGLDVVVSVCTATIHLAGAMGRDTWVMVPSVPEWRYQTCGDTMPWYSSVRLFRQTAADWNGVIERVAGGLADRIAHLPHAART